MRDEIKLFYGPAPVLVDGIEVEGDGNTLMGHARFTTQFGPVCVELHEAEKGGGIWLCLPRPQPSHSFVWYQFESAAPFRVVGHPKLLSTPYPWWERPSPLTDTGAWASYDEYGIEAVLRGNDPPHWSSVVAITDLVFLPDQDPTTLNRRLHDLLWHFDTRPEGQALLEGIKLFVMVQDLTDRAMVLWPPITARGLVSEADFPDGDLGLDHATGYHNNGHVVTGPLGEVSDEDWPGLDWDVDLALERDVAYLSSDLRPDRLRIEVEHFALPAPFRPKKDDWVQVTGRWIIDCGHGHYLNKLPDGFSGTKAQWNALSDSDQRSFAGTPPEEDITKSLSFYTEIHPPELIVSCAPSQGLKTKARAHCDGCLGGNGISHSLCIRRLGPSLAHSSTSTPRSAATTTALSHSRAGRLTTRTMCMGESRGSRRMRLSLQQRPRRNDGSHGPRGACSVLVGDGVLARRIHRWRGWGCERVAFVHPRPSLELAQWTEVPVESDGSFKVEHLEPATYDIRPAGCGWDFPASVCPDSVHLAAGSNHRVYTALPRKYPELSPTVKTLRKSSSALWVWRSSRRNPNWSAQHLSISVNNC